MLPALTLSRRRLPSRRIASATAAAILAVAAATAQLATAAPPPRESSIAETLDPSTWALLIPSAWLAAPLPRIMKGDFIDIVAVRQGERAYSVLVADRARVVSSDERGVVVQIDEESAESIAIARGSGMLLVALLHSRR